MKQWRQEHKCSQVASGPEATEEHLCPWRHCFMAIGVLEILQKVQNCTTWNVIITWLDTKHKSGRTLHNSDVKSAFTFIFVSPYREEITTPPLLWYNDIRNTNVPQSPRTLMPLKHEISLHMRHLISTLSKFTFRVMSWFLRCDCYYTEVTQHLNKK